MATDPDSHPRDAVRKALREVRREGYKVAFIHATVDAVVVLLVANLVLTVVAIGQLPDTVSLPERVVSILSTYVPILRDTSGTIAIDVVSIIAAGVGVVAFVIAFLLRLRRPIVERFEAVNPEVSEALRTARDVLRAGEDTRMARALYADVLDRLRSTSSLGLINRRRLAVSILLVLVLSVATVQLSVSAPELVASPSSVSGGPSGPGQGAGGASPGPSQGETSRSDDGGGLRSGSSILGEPENVTVGTENLSARVSPGEGAGSDRERSYDTGGFESGSGSSGIQAQRAGFAPSENVEEAELIREYNLRIREDDRNRD